MGRKNNARTGDDTVNDNNISQYIINEYSAPHLWLPFKTSFTHHCTEHSMLLTYTVALLPRFRSLPNMATILSPVVRPLLGTKLSN